jgi:Tfp pilus assembly protein PilX
MTPRNRQEGVAVLSVIMIMIVLGLAGAYLAESVSGRYAASALDRASRQADQAAASGLDWARNRALVGASCANTSLSYAGMTVAITCTALQVNENGTLYYIFDVASDARYGSYGSPDFVRRTRRARLAAIH